VLKRQKPIALSEVAWWPGGRTGRKTFCASPLMTMSTAAHAPPVARSAASSEWSETTVSASR
jgi:hypothetical protein